MVRICSTVKKEAKRMPDTIVETTYWVVSIPAIDRPFEIRTSKVWYTNVHGIQRVGFQVSTLTGYSMLTKTPLIS